MKALRLRGTPLRVKMKECRMKFDLGILRLGEKQ